MSVSTGSVTLDTILNGGYPEKRTILLTGTPGTGKSTLGMQFLQEGIENGDECLFISTEQTFDEIRDSFEPFDFDLDHENLTMTSLHAAPGRTFESEEGELVIETFEEGEMFGEGFSAPFTSRRVTEVLERFGPCDRVVLDSVSGLEPMAEDTDTFRRGVLDLIQLFSEEFEATSVFTAEHVGKGSQQSVEGVASENLVQYNVHGVIRVWREQVRGDYHRFLDVMKMRGIDHDTRKFEIEFTDTGIEIVPRRRVLAEEFVSQTHCSTGIPGLDKLAGGGVIEGSGALLKHDGNANIDALIASMLAQGLKQGMGVTLMPTVDMSRDRLGEMLHAQLDGEIGTIGDLLTNDRLFVLDAAGSWQSESDESVYNLQHEDAGIKYLLQRIDDQLTGDNHMTLLNTEAKVHANGVEAARSVRYWMEANFIESGDVLIDVHNPEVMEKSLAKFHADAATQIFETWLEDSGLQYIRLQKSPTGQVGSNRLVEYIEERPYITVR